MAQPTTKLISRIKIIFRGKRLVIYLEIVIPLSCIAPLVFWLLAR